MCFQDALSSACQPMVSVDVTVCLEQPDPFAANRPEKNHQYIKPEDDPLCQQSEPSCYDDIVKQIQDMMDKAGFCQSSGNDSYQNSDESEETEEDEPTSGKKFDLNKTNE